MAKRDISIINLLKKNGHKVREYSTLMAWKKEALVELIRILEHNWAVAIERCNNQFELLNKYHWHDLRKNPDDLPEMIDMPSDYFCQDWKLVVTAHGYRVACYRTIGRINSKKGAWWVARKNMILLNEKVIAWREIEQFEDGV